ncbi:uncharacterized protein CLUP02_11555 [Colletotrichum lupini]|uniref:Uncharacterized protein n=1 Tax=Colletotrichum lupini TaxID=145971 RepID=A0A9Q8SYT5_9PEZI|nr:uncharacterized protein CLUP02_11555 [Colletotrichum lupini]UQC86056.1 hypothetical protein CLUP02_11555 [Colletotrichum lupini]
MQSTCIRRSLQHNGKVPLTDRSSPTLQCCIYRTDSRQGILSLPLTVLNFALFLFPFLLEPLLTRDGICISLDPLAVPAIATVCIWGNTWTAPLQRETGTISAVSLVTGVWTLELSSEALTRYPYLSAPTYLDGPSVSQALWHFAACLLVLHYRLAHADASLPIRARLWQSQFGSSPAAAAAAAATECQIPQMVPDGLDSLTSDSTTIPTVSTVSIGGLQILGQPLLETRVGHILRKTAYAVTAVVPRPSTYGLAVSKTQPCKLKLICRPRCIRRPAAPVLPPPGSYLRSLTSCLVANMQHADCRLALFLKVVQSPRAHQSLTQMSPTFGTNRRSSVHVKMALVRGKIQIGKSSSRRRRWCGSLANIESDQQPPPTLHHSTSDSNSAVTLYIGCRALRSPFRRLPPTNSRSGDLTSLWDVSGARLDISTRRRLLLRRSIIGDTIDKRCPPSFSLQGRQYVPGFPTLLGGMTGMSKVYVPLHARKWSSMFSVPILSTPRTKQRKAERTGKTRQTGASRLASNVFSLLQPIGSRARKKVAKDEPLTSWQHFSIASHGIQISHRNFSMHKGRPMIDTTAIGLDSTRLASGKPARQRMKRPRIESLDDLHSSQLEQDVKTLKQGWERRFLEASWHSRVRFLPASLLWMNPRSLLSQVPGMFTSDGYLAVKAHSNAGHYDIQWTGKQSSIAFSESRLSTNPNILNYTGDKDWDKLASSLLPGMISVLAVDEEHARGKSMPPQSITQRPRPTDNGYLHDASAICLLIVALVQVGPTVAYCRGLVVWCRPLLIPNEPEAGPFFTDHRADLLHMRHNLLQRSRHFFSPLASTYIRSVSFAEESGNDGIGTLLIPPPLGKQCHWLEAEHSLRPVWPRRANAQAGLLTLAFFGGNPGLCTYSVSASHRLFEEEEEKIRTPACHSRRVYELRVFDETSPRATASSIPTLLMLLSVLPTTNYSHAITTTEDPPKSQSGPYLASYSPPQSRDVEQRFPDRQSHDTRIPFLTQTACCITNKPLFDTYYHSYPYQEYLSSRAS